jgi:lipoprotein-anchoring transpeptidase ErfK/SrfK
VALVAAGLAAALVLGACDAGADEPANAAEGASTTAAPTTATPTTEAPTTTQAPTTTEAPTTTTKPKPDPPAKLRSGSEGAQVRALQRRLHELGYQVQTADGQFGQETHHSVVAFQKVNRLGRDGVVGPITRKALGHPRIPKPRSTKAGFHVEADLTLQVVYMVRDGKISEILDASSASGQNYFIGGYALHGAYSVPPFPASHGCIRITTTAMDRWFNRIPVGTPMLVYRT